MTTKGKNVIWNWILPLYRASLGHLVKLEWCFRTWQFLWTELCFSNSWIPSHSTCLPSSQYEIEFLGDKVKVDHKGGVFIWQVGCFIRRKSFLFLAVCSYTLKKPCEHTKADVYKPGRRFSTETKLTNTLILDFQLPKQWENNFLLFKPPNLWYFVMAAWTNNGHNSTILISRFWWFYSGWEIIC